MNICVVQQFNLRKNYLHLHSTLDLVLFDFALLYLSQSPHVPLTLLLTPIIVLSSLMLRSPDFIALSFESLPSLSFIRQTLMV